MDLTRTRDFGVIGEFASFRGLKLKTVLMIRFEVEGLVRMRMERQFKVASTTNASLRGKGCWG